MPTYLMSVPATPGCSTDAVLQALPCNLTFSPSKGQLWKHIVMLMQPQKLSASPIALLGKTHKQKKRVSDDIRKNGQYHGLISWPTQNMCAHCGKKTKLHCEVCQVPLHRDCASPPSQQPTSHLLTTQLTAVPPPPLPIAKFVTTVRHPPNM